MDNKKNFCQENINETLYKWSKKSSLLKTAFGVTNNRKNKDVKKINDDLQVFFSLTSTKEKQEVAGIELYKKLWGAHHQFGPLPPFELLQKFEHDRVYYTEYRDHTTHSLFTCFLGLYIYEYNNTIKESFHTFIENNFLPSNYSKDEIFVFLWLLSSLYHDIGYLIENEKINDRNSSVFKDFKLEINKLLKTPLAHTLIFSDLISESKERIFCQDFSIANKELNSIDDIENSENFDILKRASDASCLARKDKQNEINGIKEYYIFANSHKASNRESQFRDHGISSALLLIYIWYSFRNYINDICSKQSDFDQYYSDCQECSKNIHLLNDQQFKSFSAIVNSAAIAISLHNINKNIWNEDETCSKGLNLKSFRIMLRDKNTYTAMPLAFLLRLCDELQVWNRPRFRAPSNNDKNLNSDNISIIVSNKSVFLRFFQDEERFISPDTDEDSQYYKLNKTLKTYLSEDLDNLLSYGKYTTIVSNTGNFLRIFDTNKDDFSKNLGRLLSNGIYKSPMSSEKDESSTTDKVENREKNSVANYYDVIKNSEYLKYELKKNSRE